MAIAAGGTGAGALASVNPQAVLIPDAHWYDQVDTASGRSWRISVWSPPTCDAKEPAPVFYVLDGDACFALAAQLARNAVRRPAHARHRVPIVVGIDQTPGAAAPQLRERDYTPPGASATQHFIATELMPSLARRLSLNRSRQALFGHSYAGLFALQVLLTQPDLFSHYFVASPSLWWNQGWLPRETPALVSDIDLTSPTHVQFYAGSEERARASATPERAAVLAERRPIAAVSSFAQQLQTAAEARRWPLQTGLAVLEGLDHGMARDRALVDGFHQFLRTTST